MKKILSLILTIAILMCAIPSSTYALERAETTEKSGESTTQTRVAELSEKKVTVKKTELQYKNISMSKGAVYTITLLGTKAKSYKSSNTKVVTVNSKGKVTAKGTGKASVKVTATNGKTYTANFRVFDSNKEFGEDDKSEGYDYKVLSLNYYKGQKVYEWCNYVSIDVDKFHLFSGAVKMTVDIVTDSDYSMVDISTYNDSALALPKLSDKYFKWTGDQKSKKISCVYDFTKAETDQIRNAGRLQLTGDAYTINKITLEGVPSDEIAKREAPADSPVALHGRLSIEGATMVDEKGEPYRLVGVGFDEGPTASSTSYINYASFAYLRDDWRLNCVRVSTTPADRMLDSYGFHEKWEIVYRHIDTAIQAAIDAGIYILVDFHSYEDPMEYADDAKKFFKYISAKYGDCPNIIYEITNEPYAREEYNETETGIWESIIKYCDKIIPVIRAKAPNAVIAVAGPTWADNMDVRIDKPIAFENVIYTLHFYASTHVAPDAYAYQQLKKACEAGLPALVSESSAVSCTGAGEINFESAQAYVDLCDEYNVGYFFAGIYLPSLSCTGEEISNQGIKNDCSKITGWKKNEYGPVAQWYRKQMRARKDK